MRVRTAYKHCAPVDSEEDVLTSTSNRQPKRRNHGCSVELLLVILDGSAQHAHAARSPRRHSVTREGSGEESDHPPVDPELTCRCAKRSQGVEDYPRDSIPTARLRKRKCEDYDAGRR